MMSLYTLWHSEEWGRIAWGLHDEFVYIMAQWRLGKMHFDLHDEFVYIMAQWREGENCMWFTWRVCIHHGTVKSQGQLRRVYMMGLYQIMRENCMWFTWLCIDHGTVKIWGENCIGFTWWVCIHHGTVKRGRELHVIYIMAQWRDRDSFVGFTWWVCIK